MRYSVTFLLAAASAVPAWAQTITGASPSAAERSARVVVKGSGFGFVRGDAELLIDGVTAVVTRWSDTKIRAHVAHATPLGPAEVRSHGADGAVSRDGRTLYLTISGSNYFEDPYSYLYAIDMTEGGRCPDDFDGDGTVNTLDVLAS